MIIARLPHSRAVTFELLADDSLVHVAPLATAAVGTADEGLRTCALLRIARDTRASDQGRFYLRRLDQLLAAIGTGERADGVIAALYGVVPNGYGLVRLAEELHRRGRGEVLRTRLDDLVEEAQEEGRWRERALWLLGSHGGREEVEQLLPHARGIFGPVAAATAVQRIQERLGTERRGGVAVVTAPDAVGGLSAPQDRGGALESLEE